MRFAHTHIFVNEFVKWPRPLNSIGRLKLGHPGWQLFKLVAKRQQEKQMSLGKDSCSKKVKFRCHNSCLVNIGTGTGTLKRDTTKEHTHVRLEKQNKVAKATVHQMQVSVTHK